MNEKNASISPRPGRPRATALAIAGLAGLLFVGSLPAFGQIVFRFKLNKKSGPSRLSQQLAQEIGEVQNRFKAQRAQLPTVPGVGGVPSHPSEAVLAMIDGVGRDLDLAIEKMQEPGLVALRDWARETLERQKEKLGLAAKPSSVRVTSWLGEPQAVALVASLGPPPVRPLLVSNTGEAGKADSSGVPPTVSAARSDPILDQVGKVISRLFFLAEKDDLTVELWIGSTPRQRVTFRFWPQGSASGAPPTPMIIKTNGRRENVYRGLYVYSATLGDGAVSELLASGQPAFGATGQASEKLDLVNGSSFFCCRFEEKYCHHVDDEKECQAERP